MSHRQCLETAARKDAAIQAIRAAKFLPVTTSYVDIPGSKERVKIAPATVRALEKAGRVETVLGPDGGTWWQLKAGQ